MDFFTRYKSQLLSFQYWGPRVVPLSYRVVPHQPRFLITFNNPCSLWDLDLAVTKWLSGERKCTLDCKPPRFHVFLLLSVAIPFPLKKKKKASQGWEDCSVHKVLDLQEEGSEFNPLNPRSKNLSVMNVCHSRAKEPEIDKSWTYQPDSLAYLASSRTFRETVSKRKKKWVVLSKSIIFLTTREDNIKTLEYIPVQTSTGREATGNNWQRGLSYHEWYRKPLGNCQREKGKAEGLQRSGVVEACLHGPFFWQFTSILSRIIVYSYCARFPFMHCCFTGVS